MPSSWTWGSGLVHAGAWFGTAASFVDLHSFLPAGYGGSSASSVFEANGVIYIGGNATNSATGQGEALLWVSVPEPGAGTAVLLTVSILIRRRRSR